MSLQDFCNENGQKNIQTGTDRLIETWHSVSKVLTRPSFHFYYFENVNHGNKTLFLFDIQWEFLIFNFMPLESIWSSLCFIFHINRNFDKG